MFSWIFFLLALRSYILAIQPKKSLHIRMLNIALGTFSLALFLLLPKEFQWLPLSIVAVIMTIFLYRRLKSPKTPFSFQKFVAWGCLYTVGAFVALISTFFHLTEDKKVAKIIFTGQTHSEWVSWKNPNSNLEGAWLENYEVIVEDSRGKELARQYIYGDLVGLRAEVLTIHWPFHLLGFSNLCRLETLYNGYRTPTRHNLFPHLASPLSFSVPLLQSLWSKIYHNRWKIPGIKSATLESTYLPLLTADLKPNQGSYWLVIGSSGLTSLIETDF